LGDLVTALEHGRRGWVCGLVSSRLKRDVLIDDASGDSLTRCCA
jgi:hypothetical protein